MLAAMTHPSRVLNLDMKAKALYAKELYLTADRLQTDTYGQTLGFHCGSKQMEWVG